MLSRRFFFASATDGNRIDRAEIRARARSWGREHRSARIAIGEGNVRSSAATPCLPPHVTIYTGVRARRARPGLPQWAVCCFIRENVTIRRPRAILNGAVIGAEGFGLVEHGARWSGFPQVGSVAMEDEVEIGALARSNIEPPGREAMPSAAPNSETKPRAHRQQTAKVGDFSRFSRRSGLSGSVKVGS